jgi:hypothetical protein
LDREVLDGDRDRHLCAAREGADEQAAELVVAGERGAVALVALFCTIGRSLKSVIVPSPLAKTIVLLPPARLELTIASRSEPGRSRHCW